MRTISYVHRIYVWVDQSERINAQFLGNERYYVSCSGIAAWFIFGGVPPQLLYNRAKSSIG